MKIVTNNLDFTPEINIKGICSPEEMLFFDIETTGLKKETTQVYLTGCAFCENKQWKIRQYLAQSLLDEEHILEEFLDLAAGYKALVHFNGDGFDIPYLRYKAQYYMLDDVLDRLESFDIYRKIRTCRKLLRLTSMSQRSVESFLGINRDDVYDGGKLIPVYYNYEKTGSDEAEKLLLLHNYDDIQGMLKILPVLSFSGMLDGGYRFSRNDIYKDILISDYILQERIPVPCELNSGGDVEGDYLISAENDLLKIRTKIYKGKARLYLNPVSDYYYLPLEDKIIHKDIAAFVDRKNRIKATKKNCYLEKDGLFVPLFSSWDGKVYNCDTEPEKKLIDLNDLLESDSMSIFESMAGDILGSISSC